jgi:cytochrome c-type biogenesis protein CcmH/NrfG
MDKIAAFTEILTLDPSNVLARYGLAMEYSQTGREGDALAEFDKLVAQHPDYVPAYQMAGQMLLRIGNRAAAREYVTKGLEAARRTGNSHAQSELSALLDEASAEDGS